MGFIVKQPNGLYCRFSTTCDCPAILNMTKEDYVNYLCNSRELNKESAEIEATEIFTKYVRTMRMMDDYFVDSNMTKEEYNKYKDVMARPAAESTLLYVKVDGMYIC